MNTEERAAIVGTLRNCIDDLERGELNDEGCVFLVGMLLHLNVAGADETLADLIFHAKKLVRAEFEGETDPAILRHLARLDGGAPSRDLH